jgi:flagellar hook-basal body complex protein FliE
MNPLDALSALSSSAATMPGVGTLPTAPTLPASPGAPVSEGFQIDPMQASGAASPSPTAALAVSGGDSPSTWGHMVQQMVMDVNSKQQTAAQKVADVLKGGPTPVHEAMVATEEASLSFEFVAEMRNKIVEAYQQVMQMQV